MIIRKQHLIYFWEGVKFNLIISNDPFVNYFCHKYNMSKTLLKSTVWNKTQARLHHDQHDGPETLTRWRMDIWKCSGQSRNFSNWLIVGSFPKHKGGKQGNCLVSTRKGIGWQGKLADKEVWRGKKSPSCESTNQTTQTKNCSIKITIETKVQKYVGICIFCWM